MKKKIHAKLLCVNALGSQLFTCKYFLKICTNHYRLLVEINTQ